MFHVSAQVSAADGVHTLQFFIDGFHTPEAAASESRGLHAD
jgi:hypothetical protein